MFSHIECTVDIRVIAHSFRVLPNYNSASFWTKNSDTKSWVACQFSRKKSIVPIVQIQHANYRFLKTYMFYI